MSRLGHLLTRLLSEAASDPTGKAASFTLGSGLRVTAFYLSDASPAVMLTRTPTVPPSRREAQTCANHLGWDGALISTRRTRRGWPCLVVWRPHQPQVNTDNQNAGQEQGAR